MRLRLPLLKLPITELFKVVPMNPSWIYT